MNAHYNYFRDYNPETGRYIESDPIGLNGGLNTYGYVNGSPIGNFDVFGLCDVLCQNAFRAAGIQMPAPDPKPICKGEWEYDPEGDIILHGFGTLAANLACKCTYVCKSCEGTYPGIVTTVWGTPSAAGGVDATFQKRAGVAPKQKLRPGAPTACNCKQPKAESCCD